ncbi:50S ribosomal protein L3 N(5)-glutamine methyltransferase [soil metagenome]
MPVDTRQTIADFIRWGASRFDEAGLVFAHGTDNALDEAAALVLHALELPPVLSTYRYQARLTADEKRRVLDLLEQRLVERKPSAYLTGRTWFAGHEIFVDERVLIPRSPIAELVEVRFAPWIETGQVRTILDLCTGSGCIAIACAHAFPDAAVDATDRSPEALEVAGRNVEAHGLAERVRLVESDLFEELRGRRYDLIVCNPPYVALEELEDLPAEYRHEPRMGLAAGADGLACIRRILGEAGRHLRAHGVLVLEAGSAAEAVSRAWPRLPFTWLEFRRGGSGVLLLTASELASAARGLDRQGQAPPRARA